MPGSGDDVRGMQQHHQRQLWEQQPQAQQWPRCTFWPAANMGLPSAHTTTRTPTASVRGRNTGNDGHHLPATHTSKHCAAGGQDSPQGDQHPFLQLLSPLAPTHGIDHPVLSFFPFSSSCRGRCTKTRRRGERREGRLEWSLAMSTNRRRQYTRVHKVCRSSFKAA